MTNTELLRQKIKESGYKLFHVAKCCGISYPRLMDRIYNNVEFKASEIDALSNLLGLTNEERDNIFFCHDVGKLPTV